MGEASGSAQRNCCRAGSLLCALNLHLDGPAHDSVDLRDLLLLSQHQKEGDEHLRQCAPQKQALFLNLAQEMV